MNTSDTPRLPTLTGRLNNTGIVVEGAKAIAAVLKETQLVHLE